MNAAARAPAFVADPSAAAADTLGMAALSRAVYEGADLSPVWNGLTARIGRDPADAAALMDAATLLLLTGRHEHGLEVQAAAVRIGPLYRRAHGRGDGLRLLAFVTPGDLMANTPLDFLLEGSDVELTSLYVGGDAAPPALVPEHDVAFLAVGESDANAPLLQALAPMLATWPRPVMNGQADRIAGLTRDGVCTLFADHPRIVAPRTVRVGRPALQAVADGTETLAAVLPGADYPIIARPLGSHAGGGLSRLSGPAEIAAYLAERPEDTFYLAPFVDYRGADGLYRKQRITFIDGRPFIAHMAISEHWMVHYLNAGMAESPAKREEEARFMASFDADFAVRHRAAFDALQQAIGLDYFGVDCAELPDGRLLLFEADVAMIVHAMDDEPLYPYKRPAMRKLFSAFTAALAARAGVEVAPAVRRAQ